eukprot:scaffold149_cov315-Pinguiococcus_pyrenoidosus.AAC.9
MDRSHVQSSDAKLFCRHGDAKPHHEAVVQNVRGRLNQFSRRFPQLSKPCRKQLGLCQRSNYQFSLPISSASPRAPKEARALSFPFLGVCKSHGTFSCKTSKGWAACNSKASV